MAHDKIRLYNPFRIPIFDNPYVIAPSSHERSRSMNQSRSNAPAAGVRIRLSRRRAIAHAGAGLAALGVATVGGATVGAAAQSTTPATTPATTETIGVVTPARAAQAVGEVSTLAQHILDQSGVPGMSVAIVYQDEIAFLGGFGVREIGKTMPVDEDTVFQIASLSKSVASTAVSSVVADGVIQWQSRMADLDPTFALHDAWPTSEVTLADLFAHRSGLRDHAGDFLEDLGFSREEVLHRLRYLPPAYSFRDGYIYTNFGLTAAAVAVARAVGRPWEELSRELVYQPLGMASTSSRFADYMAATNRAIPHVKQGDHWAVTPDQRNPDAQTPAGGVSSTARDLAQWMRLQLGQGTVGDRERIPADALAPTHIPQAVSKTPADPATQRASFYGLGVGVNYDDFGQVVWSHSGAFALGAGTACYLLPGSGFGVLALTNGLPVGAPEALCLSVLDLAQRGAVSRDWFTTVTPSFAALLAPTYGAGTDWDTPPASPAPAEPDGSYLGVYHNDYYGDAEIVSTDAGLALKIGPDARQYALKHYDRDTFSWQPPGENAPIQSGLTFTVGADGNADSFTDEYLAEGGAGTLTRPA
jgi:CubicO group peptidase (beta-lactamase class C family)